MECFILNKLGPTNFYSCIKVNLKYAIECSCTPAPCHVYTLKSCPPKMMALGDETFGGYLDMWVEPWWILVPYKRGHREIPNSFYHVSTKREVFCCEEGRGTSPECNHPCDFMLDFVASRAGKNICLLLKLHGPWLFIMWAKLTSIICTLLFFLAFFTQHKYFEIHPCCCMYSSFCSFLNVFYFLATPVFFNPLIS